MTNLNFLNQPLLAIGLAASIVNPSAIADTLPDVVISAARSEQLLVDSTANISVIGRAEIEASGARTVADLLRGRAGIHVGDLFGDGSNATIDMRGFGGTAVSNVLVMVDGRKLNPSSDIGTLKLNIVDLDTVEQIEIMQGSAGVLFGNQAVGGVINIITRKPGKFSATVQAGLGSYHGRELGVRVQERLASGWGVDLNVSRRDSDNYRDHNDSELKQFSLLIDRNYDGGRLFIEYDYLSEYLQTPGALFLDEVRADRRQSAAAYATDFLDINSYATRVGWRHQLDEAWRFEGEFTYRDEDLPYEQNFRTFYAGRSKQDRTVWSVNPRLIGALSFNSQPLHVTAGLDIEGTDYQQLSVLGGQAADQKISAIYAQLIMPVGDELSFSAGYRRASLDNDILQGFAPRTLVGATAYEFDDSATARSLGLRYTPNDAWSLFARVDENYRFAKVDEHTNVAFLQPVGVDNQQGVSYEAGLVYQGYSTRVGLTTYRLDLENEITFNANGININLDDTRRKGGSLEVQHSPLDTLVLGFNYDYVDGKISSGALSGNTIPLVPKHRFRLFGEWSVTEDMLLSLQGLHVSSQVYGADFSNAYSKIDGYTVFGLNFRYQQGPVSLSLAANNLFNEKYSETGNIGFDLGGSGHQECVVGFFDACPTVNPSPERSVWLKAEYRYE